MGEKLKNFWNATKTNIAAFWEANKAIIIGFMSILAVFKFRDLLMDLIVKSAKRLFQQAQEKDASLAQEESASNQQADELVAKAQKAKEETPKADEDWYKK